MQGIYKITNKINNNCYVGQSVDITKRWKEHIRWSNSLDRPEYEYPLYRALRKYGTESFMFEVLEFVDCKDDLTPREVHWYRLLKPEYNQVLPQDTPLKEINDKRKRKVLQIDPDTRVLVCEYESVREAAREHGIGHKSISDTCKGYQKQAAGYLWKYKPGE